MSALDSQTFLRELDKKLWTPVDRLRSCLDAAVYKQAVLGLIALAEEKSGGQWSGATKTLPQSRVYDSAMGFGGFSVFSERFIEEHGGKLANLSMYRQSQRARGIHLRRAKCVQRVSQRRKLPNQYNPTTWVLAAMNKPILRIDFNISSFN